MAAASHTWEGLKSNMRELRSLLKSHPHEKELRCKVKQILNSSVAYYESPERYEENDTVLQILSGRSLTPMEAAFMWLGAWRPSAAISLVFSVMGLSKQGIEVDIPVERSDVSLSEEQLSQLNNFQAHTNQSEKDLTDELATVQMMLPDQDVVTQLMMAESTGSKLTEVIQSKVDSLKDVLRRADQLRVRTLLQLHSVLTPVQAAHCGIAAFEIAFAMRSLDSGTPGSSSSEK